VPQFHFGFIPMGIKQKTSIHKRFPNFWKQVGHKFRKTETVEVVECL
jgi:hypothetical protein